MDIKQFQSSFQLISTSITDLHVSNSFLDYDERRAATKNADVSYQIVQLQEPQGEVGFTGILDLKIALLCETESKKFTLNLTLRGIFVGPAELGEAEFRRMMKVNGCAALYGIARGTISCISTQVFTVGNVVLPLANFIHFHEIELANQSTAEQ